MEILCKREDLFRGIQVVQPAVSTKGTLPILANVLLEVAEGKLNMTGTDLEVAIRCPVKVEIVKEGTITVPARSLSDIIRELPSEEVRLKSDEKNRLEISSGQAVFNLAGLPKEDYPVLPEFKAASNFPIDRDLLSEMVKKTIFSVSTDETRYILCGIYLCIEKGKITMVSTDGRRLSCISKNVETTFAENEMTNVIIPTKAANELNRILAQAEDGKVKVTISQGQVTFAVNDVVLISRLIEGGYPDYKKIIPKESNIKIKMRTQDLLQATKRVAVVTSERSLSVRYSFEKNKLTIRANSEGLGEAQDIVKIDYEGEQFESAYNPTFLMDVLKNIGCEEICLEMIEPLNPLLVRPVSEEEYISIIMPMRI